MYIYLPKDIYPKNVNSRTISSSLKWETTIIKIPWTEWRSKLWYSHKMEYYLAMRINELSLHVKSWMNLINIYLVKETIHKRFYILWFHLYKIQNQAKLIYGFKVKILVIISFYWGWVDSGRLGRTGEGTRGISGNCW